MEESEDRPRSILTPDEREFLTGEKGLSEQASQNIRAGIRRRFYNALQDFSLLWAYLPEEDLEWIFEQSSQERKHTIRTGVQDMIALSILGMWENNDYPPGRLEHAIKQAAYARNRKATVGVDVEEKPLSASEKILQQYCDPDSDELSVEEFEKAIKDPEIDAAFLTEILNRMEGNDVIVEEVEEWQEAREEFPLVRESLPYILNIQPTTIADSEDQV